MQHLDVFRLFSQRRHDLSPVFISIIIIITTRRCTTSSILDLLMVNPASSGSMKWNCAIPLIGCTSSNTCSRFTTEVAVTKDVLTDDFSSAS